MANEQQRFDTNEIQPNLLPEGIDAKNIFRDGNLNLAREFITNEEANQTIRFVINSEPIKSIRELNLGVNNLTEVPEEVSNLIYLQTMDLSDNAITQIPKFINQFKDLKFLLLGENNLDDETMLFLRGLLLRRPGLYIDILDDSLNS
jgi:Leucine-rich repeat (LRR) protein